jgi:hypothetical protein
MRGSCIDLLESSSLHGLFFRGQCKKIANGLHPETATALTQKQTADVSRIRELMGEWAEAPRNKDVDSLMRFYIPDVVVFDVVAPLV